MLGAGHMGTGGGCELSGSPNKGTVSGGGKDTLRVAIDVCGIGGGWDNRGGRSGEGTG